MKKQYRFTLEPYNGIDSRKTCPACNKNRTFTLYIDIQTGEYVATHVGRCSRENNCGYHYSPKQFFKDTKIHFVQKPPQPQPKSKTILPSKKTNTFIPQEILKKSVESNKQNNFLRFLVEVFGDEIAQSMANKYLIGTSMYRTGSTVFWYIDIKGNVNYGKIMIYNIIRSNKAYSGIDCKRDKEKMPNSCAIALHKHLTKTKQQIPQWLLDYENNETKVNCFFGEHLLQDTTKPVAITESEKTSIIASIFFPQFLWLATGGLKHFTAEKCRVLEGRKVILFPDLNAFEEWSKKAKEFSFITEFSIVDILQNNATDQEKVEGLDLADWLLLKNFKDF